MDAMLLEHYRYCPEHGCEMPCFACLIPDVAETVSRSHVVNNTMKDMIWMMPPVEGMN